MWLILLWRQINHLLPLNFSDWQLLFTGTSATKTLVIYFKWGNLNTSYSTVKSFPLLETMNLFSWKGAKKVNQATAVTIWKGKKFCGFIKVELQVCAALSFLRNSLFPVAFSATVHPNIQLRIIACKLIPNSEWKVHFFQSDAVCVCHFLPLFSVSLTAHETPCS